MFNYSFYGFVSLLELRFLSSIHYVLYTLHFYFIFCKPTVRKKFFDMHTLTFYGFIRKVICTSIKKTNIEIKCCGIIFICGDQCSWNKEIFFCGRGVISALTDLLKCILKRRITLVYVWHNFGIRLLGGKFIGKGNARTLKTWFLQGDWLFQGMN